jgi:hypothetical protein
MWTAAVGEITTSGGNVSVAVIFTSDQNETITQTLLSNNITPGYIQNYIAQFIAILTSRDTALASVKDLANQPLEGVAAQGDPADLVAFRANWAALAKLNGLGSTDATIVAQQAALQQAVAGYLKANPTALNDPFIAATAAVATASTVKAGV